MTSTSYSLDDISANLEIPVTFLKREISNAKVIAFGSPGEKRISGTELERWTVTRQFEIMIAQKRLRAKYEKDTQLELDLETL